MQGPRSINTWALLALALLLGVAVVLAWTNPTTQEYLRFLDGVLSQAIERMDRDRPSTERELIRRIFLAQRQQLLESVVRPNTHRRNFGLFSVFETRLLGEHVRVIGVARRFYPLEGVEPDEIASRVGKFLPALNR